MFACGRGCCACACALTWHAVHERSMFVRHEWSSVLRVRCETAAGTGVETIPFLRSFYWRGSQFALGSVCMPLQAREHKSAQAGLFAADIPALERVGCMQRQRGVWSASFWLAYEHCLSGRHREVTCSMCWMGGGQQGKRWQWPSVRHVAAVAAHASLHSGTSLRYHMQHVIDPLTDDALQPEWHHPRSAPSLCSLLHTR